MTYGISHTARRRQRAGTDLTPLPALDPGALSAEAVAAVRELLAEGDSPNTRRAYQSAWRYWSAWHRLRFGAALELPLAPAAVVQFIVDHTTRRVREQLMHELPEAIDAQLRAAGVKQRPGPLRLTTVVQRVAALATMHTLRRLPNPCHDPAVRHVLQRARRAHARRGERPRKKAAAAADALHAMLATCDDSLLGVRDRALLAFGWASGGRRRAEIAAARLEDLARLTDGSFAYTLPHSKTRQSGAQTSDPVRPVAGIAAQALSDWLDRAQICEGVIFRRVHGNAVGKPLTGAAVALIVKRRVALAGLSGDFSGHSLRSGFVTEAGRRDVPLPDVMAMTGHQSVQSVLGYWRSGHAQLARAATLLDAEMAPVGPVPGTPGAP